MYCETPPAEQVADLLQKLNESTNTVDLSDYSPVCIASVFKKFLRELPDPLIPVQRYDQFLEAASKLFLSHNNLKRFLTVYVLEIRNNEQCTSELTRLIQEIPEHHRSTLKFIMTHLCRICRMEYARGNHNPPTVLIQVMCHIFLRPPWEQIM